jgi:uncharacterized protein
MAPEILRFGTPARPMIGTLWMPENAQPAMGFLLCRPFGAEGVRSNALYRALATRLARAGCAVLVFDYHGTGESPGEGRYQSLPKWQHDIQVADGFLRRRTGVAACHWFGLGLGAALAARAADVISSAQRPAHLVLWDPVQNGRDYTATMCARHRREMERWFRARWDVIQLDFGEPEPELPGVVLGFEVGAALAGDLDRLGPLPLESLLHAGVSITVGRAPSSAALASLPRLSRLRELVIEQKIDWMSNHAPDGEEYRGGAIVPQDVLVAAHESLHAARSVHS